MKIIMILVCATLPLSCKPKKTAPLSVAAPQASAANTVQSGWNGMTDQVDSKSWKMKNLD